MHVEKKIKNNMLDMCDSGKHLSVIIRKPNGRSKVPKTISTSMFSNRIVTTVQANRCISNPISDI
jgi:hypothetical protein